MSTTTRKIKEEEDNKRFWNNTRFKTLLRHISPNVVATSNLVQYSKDPLNPVITVSKKPEKKKRNIPKTPGFPRTTVRTNLFSRVMEQVYQEEQEVQQENDLVDMPKGDPPPLEKIFRHVYGARSSNRGFGGGHICVVGPTGSGKSTIVRGLLCQLLARENLAVYSLESPVEVNLNTHGLFHVCQIDMFQEIQGRQRSLAETANSLLRHDPDIIYFGELRHRVDFETATSIALSGVGVISTGHASSPIDLLERLKSMNIDLKTQFRALKCILGVKRVPILCNRCKKPVLLQAAASTKSKTNAETEQQVLQQQRVLQLLNMYRIVTFSKHRRRQALPVVYVPPTPEQVKQEGRCPKCVNGYTHNHTIYEILYITPDSDMEQLRREHTYTTEETLISLILEGSVNPLYLEGFL